ncbi:sorbitol dehydrogenase-like [Lingula anatina]|uniref:Sorbitol dehydrogenase n=1 Tax=Lingula anatina TaxID=7574 RepID=A0A1S3ISN7_LINAN|nr:sorbitol dehydrogenase-like [Lingula anatina]|eukprot:XP_013401083.1 sorbitol dehydrogenase-like [Lingula anatina]
MAARNLAAVLHGKDDLRLEEIAVPEPGENEVQLSMGSVGICGSDIKYWAYGQCGRFKLTDPMIIGHEGSGVVTKVGPGVKHLAVGDRVAIEPGVPCRTCELCKEGKYNLCPEVRFCATPPIDGNLSRFYVHAADFCFKLPDTLSMEEGAMVEPLAVCVYGCQRGGVTLGSRVLICGAGPVGIMAMMVAKALGASAVCITDIDNTRLSAARSLGADHVLKVTTGDCEALAGVIQDTLGCHPHVTLECSGSDQSLTTGIHATRPGGSVVLIGRGSMQPAIPIVLAATKEVDIKGVFRYANCYPKAISLLESGKVDVKPLITHRFNLMDSVKAFEAAKDRNSGAIKVMINC